MEAYKGFNENLQCMNNYCVVEMDGISAQREENDSKVCGTHIEIKAEISIVGIVKAAVAYIKDHIDGTIAI